MFKEFEMIEKFESCFKLCILKIINKVKEGIKFVKVEKEIMKISRYI